jgi:hypothetical protein
MKKWLVAYVRLHHEKKTAERLTAMNIENFLPVQEEIRQWTYRKKKIERVVIPMMIFVHVDAAERSQVLTLSAISRYMVLHGGDSGRADGTVQIYAGLFGRGGGDVCRTIGSGRIDTSGQRSAKGTGRRTGGSGWKGESGGETGFVGMCGG